MTKPSKANIDLIKENVLLKQRIRELEHSDSERTRMEEAYRDSELKYRSLIEHSSDVVFCVDQNGEYKFVNQVFASTFGKTPDYFLGKTFWDIYPKEHADHRQATSIKVFETGESQSVEVVVPLPDRTLHYIAKANPVRDETGKVVLNVTHAIDITDRKLAEEEREKLIFQAQEALNKVKTLSGLLPICASCKKIRNDKGYWEQIETYIANRSEAEFSHGICPECAKRLYPEYRKKK